MIVHHVLQQRLFGFDFKNFCIKQLKCRRDLRIPLGLVLEHHWCYFLGPPRRRQCRIGIRINPETENRELPRKAHMHMDVKSGDCIHHIVSGSGGHGNPLERDPARVLSDVQDEKLSLSNAREQYGVVIDVATAEVKMPETEALRATRLQPAAAAD